MLLGLTKQEAQQAVAAAGITTISFDVRSDATIAMGNVVAQDPGAGLVLSDGQWLVVTVSSGPETPAPTATLGPDESDLLAYVPSDVRSTCIPGDEASDGVLAAISCGSGTKAQPTVTIVKYDSLDDLSASYDANGTCPSGGLTGHVRVVDETDLMGHADACPGDPTTIDWTIDVPDDVWGEIEASGATVAQLRTYFIERLPLNRPPRSLTMTLGPPPPPLTFSQRFAKYARLSYAAISRDNEAHIGDEVAFKGQVVQYTEDASAPFVVLLHVTKDSYGLYSSGPVGLVGYSGKPLLAGDIVEFIGQVGPLVTYDSASGSRTIPTATVSAFKLVKGA